MWPSVVVALLHSSPWGHGKLLRLRPPSSSDRGGSTPPRSNPKPRENSTQLPHCRALPGGIRGPTGWIQAGAGKAGGGDPGVPAWCGSDACSGGLGLCPRFSGLHLGQEERKLRPEFGEKNPCRGTNLFTLEWTVVLKDTHKRPGLLGANLQGWFPCFLN